MRQRPKCFRIWSGRWESNPRPKLGKLLYCHCTTPAFHCFSKYIQRSETCSTIGLHTSTVGRISPFETEPLLPPASVQLSCAAGARGFARGVEDFHYLHVQLCRERVLDRFVVADAVHQIGDWIARLARQGIERHGL